MKKIKDFEEKRLIIACNKCKSGKALKSIFSNTSIYYDWTTCWTNDCPRKRNGKASQIYRGQVVQSARKHRKGINSQKNIDFTSVLDSVSKWLNDNYDKDCSRKENYKKFRDDLLALRQSNYETLTDVIKASGLSEQGYLIRDISSGNFYELRNYLLLNGNTLETEHGSYETILERITNMVIGTHE